MDSRYKDRRHAGRFLAQHLTAYAGRSDVLVLALPRGGVPVAFEVAMALGAPLDVFLVRKLGAPGHEELAMGAIAAGGIVLFNQDVIEAYGVDRATLHEVIKREHMELTRREHLYRGDTRALAVAGQTVILIDDGLATGSTMRVAVAALRRQEPKAIVVGVPVSSPETCEALGPEVDDIVCAVTPEPFHAVGSWYQDFSQTSDEEVRDLLARAPRPRAERAPEAGH
jgi:predicted phosphoribosyltransferase